MRGSRGIGVPDHAHRRVARAVLSRAPHHAHRVRIAADARVVLRVGDDDRLVRGPAQPDRFERRFIGRQEGHVPARFLRDQLFEQRVSRAFGGLLANEYAQIVGPHSGKSAAGKPGANDTDTTGSSSRPPSMPYMSLAGATSVHMPFTGIRNGIRRTARCNGRPSDTRRSRIRAARSPVSAMST